MNIKKYAQEGDEYYLQDDLWEIREHDRYGTLIAIIPYRGTERADKLVEKVLAALKRMEPRPPKKPRKKREESPNCDYATFMPPGGDE